MTIYSSSQLSQGVNLKWSDLTSRLRARTLKMRQIVWSRWLRFQSRESLSMDPTKGAPTSVPSAPKAPSVTVKLSSVSLAQPVVKQMRISLIVCLARRAGLTRKMAESV